MFGWIMYCVGVAEAVVVVAVVVDNPSAEHIATVAHDVDVTVAVVDPVLSIWKVRKVGQSVAVAGSQDEGSSLLLWSGSGSVTGGGGSSLELDLPQSMMHGLDIEVSTAFSMLHELSILVDYSKCVWAGLFGVWTEYAHMNK